VSEDVHGGPPKGRRRQRASQIPTEFGVVPDGDAWLLVRGVMQGGAPPLFSDTSDAHGISGSANLSH